MKILAVDTATPLCGVAVLCTQSGRAAVRRKQVTTHSEMLLTLVSECLDELDLGARDLEGVVCGAGPGSFTGLRIGLATAKGLCFALGLPLTLVSSLKALSARGQAVQAEPPTLPVLAILDAFRGKVFARLDVSESARTPALQAVLSQKPALACDGVFAKEELVDALGGLKLLLVGYKGPFLGTAVDDDPAPHPLDVARIGAARLLAGEYAPLHSAVPNYLCASAAEESRQG